MSSLPFRTKVESAEAPSTAQTTSIKGLDSTLAANSAVAKSDNHAYQLDIPVCMSVTRVTIKGEVPGEEIFFLTPDEIVAIWANPMNSPGIHEGMSDAHLKAHSEETGKAIRATLQQMHDRARAREQRRINNGTFEEYGAEDIPSNEYEMLASAWNEDKVMDDSQD